MNCLVYYSKELKRITKNSIFYISIFQHKPFSTLFIIKILMYIHEIVYILVLYIRYVVQYNTNNL